MHLDEEVDHAEVEVEADLAAAVAAVVAVVENNMA